MRPLIGITVDAKPDSADARTGGRLQLNWNYAQAIADAGGVPILIPPQADAEALAGLLHGWLIPGGQDIDAKHWGEANHPASDLIEAERFAVEEKLYRSLGPSVPILGVCYGCQFLNVMRGGSLEQHLPDVSSSEDHVTGQLQSYEIADNSSLARIVGATTISGKSYHHQAVGRLGDSFEVVARHADGTIEAIEASDRPWTIGVQWHPERTLDDPASRRLFSEFVMAAAAYASRGEVAGVQ